VVAVSVRHALLALLSAGPKYGLQLRSEFEGNTGSVWPLNIGQVYTTLQRLERDGLVASDDEQDDGPQKHYRITPDGAVELDTWLRTPPDITAPPRDELVIKVLIARRLPGVDAHALIQEHRRHMVEAMQQWTRLKQDAGDDLGLMLALDFELFRLDSVVRWLDTADARIDRAPAAAGLGAAAPPVPRKPAVQRNGVRR
jgi:DNA-binding PadR family transcriptional regulator